MELYCRWRVGSICEEEAMAKSSKLSVRMCVREQSNVLSMSSTEMYQWPVPMRAVGAQNLLTMPGGVTFSGYLHKKGGSQLSLMKWPLRYIIIHKGCVYYFRSSTSPSPQGAFSLNGYNRVIRAAEETTSNNVFPFKLLHFSKKHRAWLFSAASEEERKEWMRTLRWEIEHYNERKDSRNSRCEFDSDSDGFYGTIESILDLNQPQDVTDDDYGEDDEDEKDYLMPDSATVMPPTGRPPSYPPPPVPQGSQRWKPSSPVFNKSLPPPVPVHKKTPGNTWMDKCPPSSVSPTSSIQRRSQRDPPPPAPYAPHLKQTPPFTPTTPHSPKLSPNPAKGATYESKDSKPSIPATPISEQLRSKLNLHGPTHAKGPLVSPQIANLAAVLQKRVPKSPSPTETPPRPAYKPRTPRPALQRKSPEGQSFRSDARDTKTKQDPFNVAQDSDDDYENMHLPASVYIDTVDTSVVERQFLQRSSAPQDGLYCIRNSGTKTSKVLVVWDSSICKARNYRLFTVDEQIFLDRDVPFTNLSALVEHYYTHPLPQHNSLCLQTPFTDS